jgi:hypothetical protein
MTAAPSVSMPKEIPPGGSYCPACAKVYEADYADSFCLCGTQLVKEAPAMAEELPPMAPILEGEVLEDEPPMAPIVEEAPPMAPIVEEQPATAPAGEEADVKVRLVKPPPGTPCLVLYGPDNQPLQYFALTKDATTIGRLDAVKGIFPDIDLDQWFDRAVIRRISRNHALILRTRATGIFVLRPLAGNTGTQLETDMVTPLQDYPLRPGHRIVLGGVIRLKFEIA